MSTGADCWFREVKEGRWFFGIETGTSFFVGEGDHDVWGPFMSFIEAEEHLHALYPNPGGHSVEPWAGEDRDDPPRAKKPNIVRRYW